MRRLSAILVVGLLAAGPLMATAALAEQPDCGHRVCPEVHTSPGALVASDVHMEEGGYYVASNVAAVEAPYTYQLSDPCLVDDRNTGACRGTDFRDCPAPPGRVV